MRFARFRIRTMEIEHLRRQNVLDLQYQKKLVDISRTQEKVIRHQIDQLNQHKVGRREGQTRSAIHAAPG